MRDLIVIAVLYVLALVLFRTLGGWGAAADTLRRWGSLHSGMRVSPGSSS